MQSDGGLVPVDKFSGFRAVLSGPAGGVVGYSQVTPIQPKSDRALVLDAETAAAHNNHNHGAVERTDAEKFNMAQEAVIGFDMSAATAVARRRVVALGGVFDVAPLLTNCPSFCAAAVIVHSLHAGAVLRQTCRATAAASSTPSKTRPRA